MPGRSLTRRAFLAVAASAAATGIAGGLMGCTSAKNIVVDEQPSAEPGTQLTFFGFKYEPLNVTAIEDILRAYMDEHPDVSIVYEGIKSRPYFEALGKRLTSGNGDDVFMIDHDTGLIYADQGYLADLSDLPAISSFSDLVLAQMRSEGTILYLPTSITTFGLYCNKKMLSDEGIASPQTLPEFLKSCQIFLDKGITPLVVNNDISLKTLAMARGLAQTYASEKSVENIKSFNDNPQALATALRDGFDVVEDLIERGFIDTEVALKTEKTADDLDQFATGAYPFMLTGAWASVRVHDLAPNLDYEVVPYPVLEEGSILVVNAGTRVSVNANSPHLAAAKDFLSFFSRPEFIEHFANSQCSFSPLIGNAAPDDKALLPLSSAFEKGEVVIGPDDNLRYAIWEHLRKCVVAMLEGSSAAEAETLLLSLLEGGVSS
ncbi:sugar-binding periplasmic protein/domain [Eggerthella sp. YY7918]|nr:sugar-binding periplasmic protein/domain [Eggerthella sp. YY7918]